MITSVTRDDLPDGGSSQFAKTICEIRKRDPEIEVEVLTPDYLGGDLKTVIEANGCGSVLFVRNIRNPCF